MDTPGDRLYSSEHEWILMDGDEGTVGITAFAQDQLGDIVYVEVPDVGTAVRKGEAFGVVESVKAVSDLFAPVGGEVVARNGDLEDAPELMNQSPYERGWLLRIKLSDRGELDNLLEAGAYQREVGES